MVGCPLGVSKYRGRPAAELLNLEVVVHQRARRRIAAEHQPVRFSLKISRGLIDGTRALRWRTGEPLVGHERQLRTTRRVLLPVDFVRAIGEFEQVFK